MIHGSDQINAAPGLDVPIVEQAGLIRTLCARHTVHINAEEILQLVMLPWGHVS
jgi:hypothetical protein